MTVFPASPDMLAATIQLTEASDELRHYCERLTTPIACLSFEQRIAKYPLARKHHVSRFAAQLYQSLLGRTAAARRSPRDSLGNANAGG